jgi:hypothetical protein
MRRIVALALVLAASGCRWLTEPSHPVELSSPADVTLRIGDEVRVDGILRAKFIGVPADSRCPATADCFWAGDAAVAIELHPGSGLCADTLHTSQIQLAACGGYLIELLELTPYPQTFGPIPPADYAAKLRIRTGDPP